MTVRCQTTFSRWKEGNPELGKENIACLASGDLNFSSADNHYMNDA